jgi:hypothetical protein
MIDQGLNTTLKSNMFRMLNMNDLAQRLTEVMEELKLPNRKALADFCETTEGAVSHLFSGRSRSLGPKTLSALSRTNFNVEWIKTGKGPKYRDEAVAQEAEAKAALAVVANDQTGPLRKLIKETSGELRFLTVYRLANSDDRKFLDDAVLSVIDRLEVMHLLDKGSGG